MPKSENVTAAKPKIGGAIYSAPLGTTLPKDATTALDAKFKELGYVSDDGISNKDSASSDKVNAWGGDTVLSVQKEKSDEWTYTLIEAMNVNVLQEVYGEDNVSGTLETGIEIKSNATPLKAHALVVDMILNGGVLKRVVIPNGMVSEIGEIKYSDSDPLGYETTLAALPDETGNSHYEYLQKPTTTAHDSEE